MQQKTSKIKIRCYLELLMPKRIKLLGSTKKETKENKNDKNLAHLEITEAAFVQFDILNNDYQ